MEHYDVVVIGAGNGGLAAACRILSENKSCLVCERHNIPGGFATSFVRGRFEFEASLHEFNGIGTPEEPGSSRILFEELGVADSTVFHISDEPGSDMLESYNKAKSTVTECLKGQIIMDALSDYSFYEKGVVEHPVVATDHIEPYLAAGVPNLWADYCCCQVDGGSNRMMAMSTARNRIIGQQLYKYDIAGFLQWGFNFYFTQGSREFCDPYHCNDGGWWVPAGDTFSVYPAHGGAAYESIHLLGFTAALTDLQAFKKCEELYGKEAVMAVIEEQGEITFKSYPHDDGQILSVREKINRMIADKL